jgi:hypothetical protein
MTLFLYLKGRKESRLSQIIAKILKPDSVPQLVGVYASTSNKQTNSNFISQFQTFWEILSNF